MKKKSKFKRICAICLTLTIVMGLFSQGLTGYVWGEETTGEVVSDTSDTSNTTDKTDKIDTSDTSDIEASANKGDDNAEVSSVYAGSDLDDSAFAEWLMDKGNADTIKKILADEGTEEYDALYGRIDAILKKGDNRAETVNDYLGNLVAEDAAVLVSEDESEEDDDYIYFDLNAGNVTISSGTYTGYIFEDGNTKTISGDHSADNHYYIYQSNDSNKDTTGLVDGKMVVPKYDPVTYNGQTWREYITGNNNVEDVITNWSEAVGKVGRTATSNYIKITNTSNVKAILDNLYSDYSPNSSSDGPIYVDCRNNRQVTLALKGDNRFRNVYYCCTEKNKGKLYITSYKGDNCYEGSMTVAIMTPEIKKNNTWPDCLSVIGSSGNVEYGLTFSGGTVFAGFPAQENRVWQDRNWVAFPTCVGGGNNQAGEVTINGGRLTAVTNGTSPAIGGGGGYKLAGGAGYVDISAGEVYAYSFGIFSTYNDYYGFVPTTTIGGASTFNGDAKNGTTVNISGGYVHAESVGGTAIGGGCSRNGTGGDAAVNITGGTVEAESVAGTANNGNYNVGKGTAIGGGVGTIGGAATVNISSGTVDATSIGGGNGSTKEGGSATIHITGGRTTLTNGIGGGDSEQSDGGAATVTVEDGYIHAGQSIGGGTGCTSGSDTKGDGGAATITISGGELKAGTIGGGSTKSENTTSHIGFARAYISGGDIKGQFLLKGYLEADATDSEKTTGRCIFQMTGGCIYNTVASNPDYPGREENGGAVWMDDLYGEVSISGGTIKGCEASNGGAIYMTDGTFTLSGTGSIESCQAVADSDKEEGSDNHLTGRGGAVYLGGGRAVIEGGNISNCTASNGAGLYVSGGDGNDNSIIDSEVESIANTDVNPENYNVYISGGSISYNIAEENGGGVCVNNGHVLMDGGAVDNNRANGGDGGGIYLSSLARDDARVRVRSGSVSGNYAAVRGGAIGVNGTNNDRVTLKVTIGVNEDHYDNNEFVGCMHTYENQQQQTRTTDCPSIKNNRSVTNGGAIYITGGSRTLLNIYCIEEDENDSDGDEDQSNFMMVEGGTVIITTGEKNANSDAQEGHTVINGSIHILGGSLDIYGEMKNPKIEDVITVDLQSETDHFEDHRVRQESDPPIYWVHYYENFPVYDESGNLSYRTGRFKAYSIDASDGYEHVIRSSLFNRPGYLIQGWHTTANGEDTDIQTDNEYEVGDTYTFPAGEDEEKTNALYIQSHINKLTNETVSDLIANTDGIETNDGEPTTLVLYALWTRGSYYIQFDANSTNYEGEMPQMLCNTNESYELSANEFIVQGMKFAGWDTKKDGTGTRYADGATVKDLADVDGSTITLYAQWTTCAHPADQMIYEGLGGILTQTCSICKEKMGTAAISAISVEFDGNFHEANDIDYSDEWIGEKNLTVTYTMACNAVWDDKDTALSEWNDNPIPLHAGSYTASISSTGCDGVEAIAYADYKIYQIPWDTPEQPQIDVTIAEGQGSTATIKSPLEEGMVYQMTYIYQDNEYKSEWQSGESETSGPSFTFSTYNVFHYFYAKKLADRDHTDSEASVSMAYLSHNGIIVIFDVGAGILLEQEEGSGDLTFTTKADDGYHLGKDYTISHSISPDDNNNLTEMVSSLETDGSYRHVLTGLNHEQFAGATVKVTISGAKKDADVTAKVTDDQVFTDFNGKSTVISRDSAYTSSYTVKNYIPEEYSSQSLKFGSALPTGTTLILKSEGSYYYCNLTSSTAQIDLSEFTSMGGNTHFAYDTAGSSVSPAFTYQLVIDFSQVEVGKRLSAGELTADLTLTPKADSFAPLIPAENTDQHHVSVGLKDVAGFALNVSDDSTETPSVTCSYTASEGTASIWNDRISALVLTTESDIPADLYIEADMGMRHMTCYRNEKGQFIIPLSTLKGEDMTMKLCSGMFPDDENSYDFTVNWYISASKAGSSPLNGHLAATENMNFKVIKKSKTSLRVVSEKRLLHLNDKLEVALDFDVPKGSRVEVELLRKSDGQYLGTGFKREETSGTETSEGRINFSGNISYSLAGQSVGNFCLMYSVYNGKNNLLQVPYYFILLP